MRCKALGCENHSKISGYCGPHYHRWYRHGDPLAGAGYRSEEHEGKKFGRLTAIRKGAPHKWFFLCECGNEKEIVYEDVKQGKTTSCGCFRSEATSERLSSHGHANRGAQTRAYRIWCAAKTRCTNPNTPGWDRYGGRGITMCDRWINSFEAFLDDMGEPPEGMIIDRIDNNGNYEPGNCRWATIEEQSINKEKVTKVEWEGKTYTLKSYSKLRGVGYTSMWKFMKKGTFPSPHEAAEYLLRLKKR